MAAHRPSALLIVNPAATTTRLELRDLITAALGGTVALEVAPTRGRGHATELAADARARGVRTVIVLGGDGTANEVIQSIAGSDVALALVPGGGANVLARALGIPVEPVAATSRLLGALRAGRRRRIGLGRADERLFAFNAGLGFDAAVVGRVEQHPARKQLLRQLAFAKSALDEWGAGAHAAGTVHVRAHGVPTGTGTGTGSATGSATAPDGGPFALALVANTSPYTYLGDRALVAHPGASFDRGLDLLTLDPLPLARLALIAAGALANGRHVRLRGVTHHRDLAGFTLHSESPLPVHVDGDPLPARTELRLEAVPRALDVVV
jgi:diacylglycerol kinase family enzyme